MINKNRELRMIFVLWAKYSPNIDIALKLYSLSKDMSFVRGYI